LLSPFRRSCARYAGARRLRKLKELTPRQGYYAEAFAGLCRGAEIPEEAKQELKALTPANYIGNAGGASTEGS